MKATAVSLLALLHRDELVADWALCISGENPYKIAPL